MSKKVVGFTVALFLLALIGSVANRADEFTEDDLKRWKAEYMSVVQTGRELWVSPDRRRAHRDRRRAAGDRV